MRNEIKEKIINLIETKKIEIFKYLCLLRKLARIVQIAKEDLNSYGKRLTLDLL